MYMQLLNLTCQGLYVHAISPTNTHFQQMQQHAQNTDIKLTVQMTRNEGTSQLVLAICYRYSH